MAAEQRIIGSGLLVVGICVVLILVYVFSGPAMDDGEAYDLLIKEVYPNYIEAEKSGEYLAMKREAEEALRLIEKGGRNLVVKRIEADASTNRSADRLLKLVQDGAFQKNAEDNEFRFESGWFRPNVHRSLTTLRKAIDEELKPLRRIREAAQLARTGLELARTASGAEIPLPAAQPSPRDEVPVASPNPIYSNDLELYRVFGVRAATLQAALGTKGAGAGRARSARLKWKQEIAGSNVSFEMQQIPELAAGLRHTASRIERSAREIGHADEAKALLDQYLAQAAALLAIGLDEPHDAEFKKNRAKFANAAALATILRGEAQILSAYKTVRDLGKVFAGKFE